jgi:muconate cycloisomerase
MDDRVARTRSGLTITALDIWQVAWPLKMKRRHGVGDIEKTMPGVIVRIATDGSIAGWGEAAPWAVFTGTAEANALGIHAYLRPLLLGADPFDVTRIMLEADHALVGHPEGKAAVEMALLDIVGQRLGVPVASLFGGLYRDAIPLSVSIANPDFAEDVDLARDLAAKGINIFKVKTGFLTHCEDLARLEKLRAVLPESVDLRIDYNQGLEPWDAIPKLRDVEAFRPTFIEQPVRRQHLAAMAAIAAALDTPIMADESVFTPAEAVELVRQRAADLVSIKIMKAGGITKAREVAAIAAAAGIAGYGGTMFEGGIAIAAGLHLVAATPNISLGAEFYTSTYVMGAEVLAEPIRIAQGRTLVPTGAGLGITVDEDAVRRIAVAAYA